MYKEANYSSSDLQTKMPQSIGQALSVPQRIADVHASLSEQDHAIASLEELVKSLVEKLVPISHSRPPAPEKISETNGSSCAVSGSIRENTRRIKCLTQTIATQIESLEV